MDRVIVTRPMVSLLAMQVCAIKDATDEEILDVCNRDNPAGTTNGWTNVVRTAGEDAKESLPVQCEQEPDRMHFLVLC